MSNFSHGLRFPEAITPTLDKVLRMSHSDLVPLADVFRAAGHTIPTDTYSMAAFVRFQLVRLAVNYPEFLEPTKPAISAHLNASWQQHVAAMGDPDAAI